MIAVHEGPHEVIEVYNFDLKAVNFCCRNSEDIRTPEELLHIIEAKGREVAEALAALRARPTNNNDR